MDNFKERVAAVKARSQGHWDQILTAMLSHLHWINGKNQPCPKCGGTDRFQYSNKFGNGDAYCRKCGHMGGFDLLEADGMAFPKAVERVEQWLGVAGTVAPDAPHSPPADRMRKIARRLWDQAKPIQVGDEVDRYLRSRKLAFERYPRVLRYHPNLGYYERTPDGGSKKVGEFPAMLACVQGVDGHAITLHRTYLKDGIQAHGRSSKKVLSAGFSGAAIRLCTPTDELGIAEGIETALAAHLLSGIPVWAAISAGNMERVWLPDTVKRILIFADNDADSQFDGQASAYALARRLRREWKGAEPRRINVFVAPQAGSDWADVWQTRCDMERGARMTTRIAA